MEARCQCGQITFSTPSPVPHKVYICHCTECRHQSSSAFSVSAVFPLFDIADLVSLPRVGECTRLGLSGRTVHCYFCRNCGARLIHRVDGNAHLTVKAGCFDGLTREMLKYAVHVWTNHAVVDIPSDAVQFAEGPLDEARKEHAKG